MADTSAENDKIEKKLWKAIDQQKIGMLGAAGGAPKHLQPMTGFCDPDRSSIWFYSRRDTDLARDVGEAGHAGMFCFADKDRELWACLGGDLSLDHDPQRIEDNWSPVVAAWYPEGKDDPQLTLIRLEVVEARVWVSELGPLKFGYAIAKANATHRPPDVGSRTDLNFQ